MAQLTQPHWKIPLTVGGTDVLEAQILPERKYLHRRYSHRCRIH